MSNESERVTLTVEISPWIQVQSPVSHKYEERIRAGGLDSRT
jgi:hypothetical protein